MPNFILVRPDDETLEVKLVNEVICTLSHDSDGWDGMEKVETIIKRIALIFGVTVMERVK